MSLTGYVYKLVCKDPAVTDCYVGSTRDMKSRKSQHRCHSKTRTVPLYIHIRDNGGFENWEMIVCETVAHNSKFELTAKEREWLERLGATLNSTTPAKTPILCEHGGTGRNCVKCDGLNLCEHKRTKSSCIECGGSNICDHKRVRARCVDCEGASICQHKRERSHCVDCGGSQICPHKKQKRQCVDCGGDQICPHKKQKGRCGSCDPTGNALRLQKRREAYAAKKAAASEQSILSQVKTDSSSTSPAVI